MTASIPRNFIEDVLTRVDLVDVINARINLRKRGANYIACCPFHNEKTPSFTVQPEKQFYYCFGCGATGNAISFLMDYDRLDFVETIKTLASQVGMTIPTNNLESQDNQQQQAIYDLLTKIAAYYQQQLREHPTAAIAVDYLKKRGLTGHVAKHFAIGFAPNGWDNLLQQFGNDEQQRQLLLSAGMLIKKDAGGYYDRFRNRIMFPIHDRRGRVIAFGGRVLDNSEPKYLNSPETPVFHKGNEFYGLYQAFKANRDLEHVLIVEGYMDVVALTQYGINFAIATLGTATTSQHLKYIFRFCKKITFCFDGDRAGHQAAKRALETALPLISDDIAINFLLLPEGDDPDSFIRKNNTPAFSELINKAKPLSEYMFETLIQEGDITTLQGKAQLGQVAMKFINQMPDTIFKEMLIQELAKRLRLEEHTLQRFTQINSKTTNASDSKNLKTTAKTLSPVRQAITLLLQNPAFVMGIASQDLDIIQQIQVPGISLLVELIQTLQQNPSLKNTGLILEHWREKPESKYLHKLAMWQHPIAASEIEPEFADLIKRILTLHREQSIQQLLNKLSAGAITAEEKILLQSLINQRDNISL